MITNLRRALVRGKTAPAEDILRDGHLPPAADIEVCPIPEPIYQRHFALFNDLDRICGVGADDHAVEEVEPDRLPLVTKTLKTYPPANDRDLADLLDRMWGLCWRAEQDGRSVYFVL